MTRKSKRDHRTAVRRASLARLISLGRFRDTTPTVFDSELAEARSQLDLPASDLPYMLRTNVDLAVPVPGHGIFVAGWLVDPGEKTTGMFLHVDGVGTSDDFASNIERTRRDDVTAEYKQTLGSHNNPGFLCFVQIPNLPKESTTASLILRIASDDFIRVAFTLMTDMDKISAVKHILNQLPLNSHNILPILNNHVGPAVEALWATPQKFHPHLSVKTYGLQVDKPRWTIIVPLYGRYDFIHYQLSQFADDSDFRKAELRYVVDDPQILDAVLGECAGIFPIFGLPFKVLYSGLNLGYAGANNLGAANCTAETLVLLNSDVLPAHSGWLGRLDKYRQTLSKPGAVGPKLLYEDGSIQHAGMSFRPHHLCEQLWMNEHPGKGQPDWLTPEQRPVRVPAVTGACMMLGRSLYENVGGLDESFILGDYEDSDLCLKLLQVGCLNYYVPNVQLYHLERQSDYYDRLDHRIPQITIYNCWRQYRKWDSQIKKIVEQFND